MQGNNLELGSQEDTAQEVCRSLCLKDEKKATKCQDQGRELQGHEKNQRNGPEAEKTGRKYEQGEE